MQTKLRQDEADGLMERALTISTQAAAWHTSRMAFGMHNGSYEVLAAQGLAGLGMDTTNVRGRYGITDATPFTLEVTGVSTRYPGIGVRVYISEFDVDSSATGFNGEYTL